MNQFQMACYIVSEFLSRHGKLEDAERFWLHAIDEPLPGHLQTEIASARLFAAGIKAEDLETVRAKLGMKERFFSK